MMMNNNLLAFLFLCSCAFVVLAKPAAIQLLDETSLPQMESEENTILNEDLSPPIMRKPHKMADRKRKRVDGSPTEKMDEFRNPMDIAPSVDLFQQLMLPIDNTESNEMERLFNMKYEKFDESPRNEGPK